MNLFFALSILMTSAFAYSSELSKGGMNQTSEHIRAASQSRFQIARILEAESRVSTVRDAMAIKSTGLTYVRDLADFELLASYTVADPSDAYILAVGDFIAQYTQQFTSSYWDIEYLVILEKRTKLVRQAMAVKNAGLKIASSIDIFLKLLPFSVPDPSNEYKNQVSIFVAQNIRNVLSAYSPIYMIVEAETFTLTVRDAMAVKNAGLVAVRSKSDLLDLAVFSVKDPSDSYRTAVSAFIRDNIARYP